MENVTLKVEGSKLVITVDLAKQAGASKSGKSIVIGTSGGNVDVPGHPGVKLGLNVYKPAAQS